MIHSFRRRGTEADTVGLVSPAKSKTNPLGAGRNPRAGEPARPLAIRVTDAERARYQAAADAAGVSLGDWIRASCEARLPKRRKA